MKWWSLNARSEGQSGRSCKWGRGRSLNKSMFGPRETKLRRRSEMNELLQLGAETCNWLGLTEGRFYQCLELAKDFHERSHHSRDHIYAYQELHEMVAAYQLLKSQAHKYPGLTEKVRQVFTKGPVLRVNETKENNKARNNLFTYYLAGRLMKAGINVVAVDECVLPKVSRPTRSDIAILWRELYLEF